MTLGDPQPLSRRQARELARAQGEEIADEHETIPTRDAPVRSPAVLRPASFAAAAHTPSPRQSSGHQPTVSEPDEATGRVGAASAEAAPEPQSVEPLADLPPHALSRRELRAQHAREDANQARAAQGQPDPADVVPVAAVPLFAVPLSAEPITDELIEAEPVEAEPVEAEPVEAGPVRTDDAPSGAQTGWTPRMGHWSVDAGAPRAEAAQPDQSLDELINRGIGAGGIPTTTNALILPSIPHHPSSDTPISNTGEIMITGSFDLPRSLGATGAHPNLFDSSEMDHLMDQLDADQIGGDSAPVSASHAVSTHASTRGVLTPPKKQRAMLPTILVVTTAVLAVGVLALFVSGYLLGSF